MLTVANTWPEISDSKVDTAILSFGSIEQHGHHLPIGTDWILGQAEAEALGRELNALVYPTMPFGCSQEHMDCPGTVTLRPSTLAAVLEDLVVSLRHHGIKKIIVLSSHGGNWILKPTLRDLNFRYPDMMIIWGNGPLPEKGDTVPEELHAGRGETSRMMHVSPALVREGSEDLDSPGVVGREFLDYVGINKVTKHGAWGLPSQANVDLGCAQMHKATAHQAEYVKWVFERLAKIKSGKEQS